MSFSAALYTSGEFTLVSMQCYSGNFVWLKSSLIVPLTSVLQVSVSEIQWDLIYPTSSVPSKFVRYIRLPDK